MNRVRVLRQKQGISLRDLAERSGVSRAMLNYIERGTRETTVAKARAIAAALNVSLDEAFPPLKREGK